MEGQIPGEPKEPHRCHKCNAIESRPWMQGRDGGRTLCKACSDGNTKAFWKSTVDANVYRQMAECRGSYYAARA